MLCLTFTSTTIPVTLTMSRGQHLIIKEEDPFQIVGGVWIEYQIKTDQGTFTINLGDYSDKAWEDFTYLWGAKRWQ